MNNIRYVFLSNHNVLNKSCCNLCFLAPDHSIKRFYYNETIIYLLKDLVPKNKGHTNFYEHCELRKEYIYAAFLDFWRRSWSSNWLMGVPIDFHWLQLTLLNPHDSLLVKWIVKIFLNFCQKTFQFTFRLQNTLLNCTWSGPKRWIMNFFTCFTHEKTRHRQNKVTCQKLLM